MKRLAIALTAAALAAGAQAAPTPNAPETVVVTGSRLPDGQKKLEDVIGAFVAQHAAPDRKTHQLVRDAPAGVCPLTLGLAQPYNDFVTKRIAQIAVDVGAHAQDPASCRANIEVLFTKQPQIVVDRLAAQTGGAILGFHWVHETKSIQTVRRPVSAWYITGTEGKTFIEGHPTGGENYHKVLQDRAYDQGLHTGTGSHIAPRYESRIMNALIVVDMNKLDGAEIGPLSDYIAMLALSQARSLDDCNDLPSILDRFAAACAARAKPDAMTASDLAYLKALYAADLSAKVYSETDDVTRDMATTLGGTPPAPATPGP